MHSDPQDLSEAAGDSGDSYVSDDDGPPYEDAASIHPGALARALGQLSLFDDPYLRMQTTNLGMVDVFLNQLEQQLMRALVEEDGTPLSTAFVSAQSQMWIFAAYELLRTWKQRAKDTMKLIAAGRVETRLVELEKDLGYRHGGREIRAGQLRRIAAMPDALTVLDADLRRIHVTFGLMNMLRMSLAKHEVQGVRDSVAFAPGYGRINRWCGAIDYELSWDAGVFGTLNHRDIADGFRRMWLQEPQSAEELAAFDQALKGPPKVNRF
jgi:hypothetical protein